MSKIPLYLDVLGRPLDGSKKKLISLGNLESKLLSFDIEDVRIERPIFISGLARAGSTILLEMLASHPDVSTHQYRDYPYVHAHYFWRKLRWMIPEKAGKIERAHQDRIMINAQSPEAMDEILWTSFFDGLHGVDKEHILEAETGDHLFELFYKEHIKKNLCLHNASRFASKNNYNITRIKYMKSIFPDARFVIPVRSPEAHIASLVKQNKLFMEAQKNEPRSKRYTKRTEHYEFGDGFMPIHFGKDQAVKTILDHWSKGEYALAYAHYWAMTHDYIYEHIVSDPELNECVEVVYYDDLCDQSEDVIRHLISFCGLEQSLDEAWFKAWGVKITSPDYYASDFSSEELFQIRAITEAAHERLWS